MAEFFSKRNFIVLWAVITVFALVGGVAKWGNSIAELANFLESRLFEGESLADKTKVFVINANTYLFQVFNFDPKGTFFEVQNFKVPNSWLVIVVTLLLGVVLMFKFDKSLDTPSITDEYKYFLLFLMLVWWSGNLAQKFEIPLLKETVAQNILVILFVLYGILRGSKGVTERIAPFARTFAFLNLAALYVFPKIFGDIWSSVLRATEGLGKDIYIIRHETVAVWAFVGLICAILWFSAAFSQDRESAPTEH